MRNGPEFPGISETSDEQDETRAAPGAGRLIQLAVFLGGFIVTLIVAAALNSAGNTIITEDHRRLTGDAQERVGGGLTDLAESLRTVSAVINLSGSASNDEWKKRILYAAPRLKKFDRVLLIGKDTVGNWQRKDILEGADDSADVPALAPGAEDQLKSRLGASALNPDATAVLSDLAETPPTDYPGAINIRERPFILAHLLNPQNPDNGIVIGLSRVSKVAGANWLAGQTGIERIVVRDVTADTRVFGLIRGEGKSVQRVIMPDEGQSFGIGNDKWQLVVDAGAGSKAFFLEGIPVLVLVAGLLLSAAGAMHVRTPPARKAQRLTAMNRALAEKSSELNTEVTERARLNNVYRKAERENKAVIDSISDIIFEVTGEGEIVFLNKAWEKITGFTVEQSLQRKLFDMLHPQDQEEQRRNFEQMVKGQKSAYRVLTRIRTANGTFRSVELAVSMLRLDENRNMRVVGAMTDVEERRRAEKALGEVEKKYKTIVENAAGGIYQVTPEGQFLSANPAMARILGYDSTEQMLREVKNAHLDIYEDRQEHSRYLGQLEKFGSVKNFENRVRARDGRLVWVNENARSVKDDEGNILYYEGSMEDITRRKEIEIKLREAKIQSDLANRAKSEFLANMSHELRTPLNAIIGFSEIIKDEVLGPMQNRQYWEYARDIHTSGKGLLKIISEILEISRIETGERQMVEGVVDISKVGNACVEFLAPKAEAGKLIVANNLGTSPKIIGEELAVKQILLNLLSNAIKFTPAGGHITLSHETDSEGQLRISVTDTGIGLDEEEIVKALSPFGQVDSTLGRSGSGTGLGLTLVDSLVRMHGGKLELFSQKGLGTTATLIFPAKRVAQ